MADPWTKEQRAEMTRRMDAEAAEVGERLGAQHVVVIAFFVDGDYMHSMEGGNPPMPYGEMHRHMVTCYEIAEQAGGEDVRVQ